MAMSLALVGLKIPGIVIDNPACVAKTYPSFFDDSERLRYSRRGRELPAQNSRTSTRTRSECGLIRWATPIDPAGDLLHLRFAHAAGR